MRRLVLLVPHWPVLASGHRLDEPVVVVEHGHVLAASPAARRAGVRRGQRRRDAEARLGGLSVLERDPAGEARRFEPVVRALIELAADLELVRPGLCALATRGPARYFGGEEALVALVRERTGTLVPEGACACVGIADSHLAAVLAAREDRIVVPGGDAAFLAPFPVALLGPSRLTDVLAELGITTLGRLAATDEGLVTARFGTEGADAWRRAAGRDEEPLVPRGAPVELALTAELDPPAVRVDEVAFSTRTLTEDFLARLVARGLSCGRVVVELETEHGESLARCWRLPRPLLAERLAERLRWQLEGWLGGTGRDAPSGGIALVRLSADALFPARGDQLDLLARPSGEADRARRALDRLSALVGEDALFTAVLGGGRAPAERARLVAWGEPTPAPRADGPWPGHDRLPAPAVVYAAPLACEVLDRAGALVAVSGRGSMRRRPVRLRLSGAPARAVTGFGGPWLYEEAWWARRARRRARLQLTLEDGSAHLCYLEQGRWWLEASYD